MGRPLPLLLTATVVVAACTHATLELGQATPPGNWWNPAFGYRMPVEVVAGSAVVPSGYSVALTFDHAALVAAGHAAADGNDLVVVEGTGASAVEVDRVLDDASSWDSPNTTLWFRAPSSLGSNASLQAWLYYGNPSAPPPPDDPSAVFLFFDGFESGGLSNWNLLLNSGNYWSVSSAHTHSGSFALHAGQTGNRKVILANGVNESDLELSAWWYETTSSSLDFSQVVRAGQSQPLNMYKTDYYSQQGFDVSKIISNTYTQIESPHGSMTPDTWTRVTMRLAGTSMVILADGAQVSPPSGSTGVGGQLSSGTVGFQNANVPAGAGVWLDDVRARRYVEPEPAATAGAEQTGP